MKRFVVEHPAEVLYVVLLVAGTTAFLSGLHACTQQEKPWEQQVGDGPRGTGR